MPFATANGIRLYYEWHGAEDGVPVVLVMGLGGDSTAWPFQLAALDAAPPRARVRQSRRRPERRARRGVHHPGHGRGPPRPPRRPRRRACAPARAVARRGDRPGGRPRRARAVREPPAPRDVGGTAPLLPGARRRGPHGAAPARPRELLPRAERLALHPRVLRDASPSWWRWSSSGRRTTRIRWRSTPISARPRPSLGHDARDRVHLIRCPTLVAVGSQDLITPPLLAEELASRIPGARLRVSAGRRARRHLGSARRLQPPLPRLPGRGQTLTSRHFGRFCRG